ncbi:MAG: sigma 54-interacting transcriptional regulator [Myxococcales bacterium]|nr:sigma 54-interacting transcriptional regulator [Myxococcales bacterium]
MSDPTQATLSVRPASSAAEVPAPALFVAFEGARPLALAARFSLADVDLVTLGRGPERAASRTTVDQRRVLAITIPDPQMSTRHAVLERELGRWIASDAGSKNGTFLDGAPLRRAVLPDGTWLELGHTLVTIERRAGATDLDASTLPHDPPGLATVDPELAAELAQLRAMAPSLVPISIGGETGTGKELIARAVHALSARRGPLVAVNCGALPPTLVEAELFGVRRGAFSGATEDRPGLVRQADGGTLFLDEIGDLPLSAQAALLRVLQEREVRAVGDTRGAPVDFRLVTATLHDLDARVRASAFRADLRARISGFHIELPALRDRRVDLGLLIGTLLARLAPGRSVRFALDAVRALARHAWPANIRELERCLAAALTLADSSGTIEAAHLPASVRSVARSAAADLDLDAEQRALRDDLVALLQANGGNISAVARQLGKARMQVQRWIARFGLDPARYRSP